jgi:hypothetical protein
MSKASKKFKNLNFFFALGQKILTQQQVQQVHLEGSNLKDIMKKRSCGLHNL